MRPPPDSPRTRLTPASPAATRSLSPDLNRDSKPDIIAVASGLEELRWYENPGWARHVLVGAISQPINAAAHDVDGDGIPEIALAHGFSNVYTRSLGIVSILTQLSTHRTPGDRARVSRSRITPDVSAGRVEA